MNRAMTSKHRVRLRSRVMGARGARRCAPARKRLTSCRTVRALKWMVIATAFHASGSGAVAVAIPELRGKPMLDIAAVTTHPDLRAAQREFEALGFHRRDVWVDRDDKPYVCGSVEVGEKVYNINLHICHRNDSVHKDSLAFMEILNRRPDLRRKYEETKDRAHSIDPANPEIYNREKEAVIREIHSEALARNAGERTRSRDD